LTVSDVQAALEPIVLAFEDLSVRYYVGGSLASASHGVPRASIDADVIAELGSSHVRPLVDRLAGAYYIDEGRVRTAVDTRRSFNVIHLATMFKIDVFVMKARPFDREAMQRAQPRSLTGIERPFRVASPEDTVIAKLEWFRAGGEQSERQWSDIVGVLRTAANALDHAYLARWADAVGVRDLLERAQREIAS
jgi:hypothetical protein